MFSEAGRQCFTVTVIDDNLPLEGEEIFRLILSVPSFPSITDTFDVTILDNVDGQSVSFCGDQLADHLAS